MSRVNRGVAIAAYRGWVRARDRLFALGCRGAFASFGHGSVIQLPVRLSGERRIMVGSEVFVGAGSWIQVLGEERLDDGEPAIRIGDGTSIAGSCVLSAAGSITIGR